MNISGVTQTAQVLPPAQPQAAEAEQGTQVQSPAQGQSTGADVVNLSAQVSTQVLDMAQRQFEDAANELISTMAASTGVGANVDMSV